MTDEEKAKAALAEKDRRIADLEKELASVRTASSLDDAGDDDVRARAVAEAEERDAIPPTPSQEELDHVKLGSAHAAGKRGSYKTRQSKPG